MSGHSTEGAPPAAAEPSFDLSRNVNYLLRRAHVRADALFQDAMAGMDLTPRQAALLYAVARCPGGSIRDLSGITGMDRGTLSEMIPRLVGRKLLTRVPSEVDGRAKSVFLTEEGKALLAVADDRTADLSLQVLDPLPPEYRGLFIKALVLMVGLEVEVRTRALDPAGRPAAT